MSEITIKDVAKLAQVSVATVSRVLNNNPYPVAEETREKVIQAAQYLNFKPSRLAQGLKLRRSTTFGLIFPTFLAGTLYSKIFHAVENEAIRKGYGIVLGTSYGKAKREEMLIDLLRERRVDGLLVIPSSEKINPECYKYLKKKIPLVFLDRYLPEIDTDRVTTDNVKGAYIATRHLIRLGREKIVFLSGPEAPCTSIEDRIKGYKMALDEAGIGFRRIIQTEKYITRQKECGYKAMKRFLSTYPKFSALFAANDNVAIGALRAIREAGLKVPDDVAVVGYDDDEMAPFLDVPLTTVAQQKGKIGKIAVKLLLERIKGWEKGPSQHIQIEPRLVIRASCGANLNRKYYTRR